MKEIIAIKKCNHCRKKLTLADIAFHEVLCGKCQWKVNEQVRVIMRDVFPEILYVEPRGRQTNQTP